MSPRIDPGRGNSLSSKNARLLYESADPVPLDGIELRVVTGSSFTRILTTCRTYYQPAWIHRQRIACDSYEALVVFEGSLGRQMANRHRDISCVRAVIAQEPTRESD